MSNEELSVTMKDTTLERMSNTEFITDLMEYNPAGVMGQAVIIEAIAFYTKMAKETPIG